MFAITSKLKVLTPLKFVNRPATTHARILNRALSSMATKPVPILATGRAEAIGRVVIDSLKPDFEGPSRLIYSHRLGSTPAHIHYLPNCYELRH